MESVSKVADLILGEQGTGLTVLQMTARALLIYVVALALIRIFSGARLVGRNTAFDVILGIIFGSTVSRAINGEAPLSGTIVAGIGLVTLHWVLAEIAVKSHSFGNLIKGKAMAVYSDGEIVEKNMKKAQFSRHDLDESLRLNRNQTTLAGIETARLERSGEISFIRAPSSPRVIEVKVEDGVKTIRIEIGGAT